MTKPIVCPSEDVLLDLIHGKLEEPRLSDWAEHFEDCGACQERARTLSPDDTLVQSLRSDPAPARKIAQEAPPPLLQKVKDIARSDLTGGETLDAVPDKPVPSPSPHDPEIDFLAPPQEPDEIGRLGSYRILSVLGHGGMGMVFLAHDPHLDRRVAIKVMLPKFAANEAAKTRFLREARTVAKIQNDHIVNIFQVSEDRGVPFLAMEFLEGATLDAFLQTGRQLTVPQILRVGRDIAKGLAAAHEKGLIHRDIKPANLWLDKANNGRIKILDFGLARAEKDDILLTQSGAIVGTPAYMAPEQARCEKNLDARADLFSLGCVLYRLCSGDIPFKSETTMGVLMALALNDPTPPSRMDDRIPSDLSDFIMQLLEKDPAKRPGTARAVIARLVDIETRMRGQSAPGPETSDSGLLSSKVWTAATEKAIKPGLATQIALTIHGPAVAAPSARKQRSHPSWLVVMGAVAAAALLFLVAAVVFYWQLPDGQVVRIEADDDTHIAFDHGELKIVGAYKEPLTLSPGVRRVKIKKGDFEFETDKLVVSKGDKIALKIEVLEGNIQIVRVGQGVIVPKTGMETVKATPPSPARLTQEERKTLDWILAMGGRVDLLVDDKSQTFRTGDRLPDVAVVLHSLFFTGHKVFTEFNDESLENLRVLPKLQRFALGDCPVTDAGIARLLSFPCLQSVYSLDFVGMGITDASLKHVSSLRSLQGLNLGGCSRITGTGLKHLANLPKLTVLALGSCKIDERHLSDLRGLRLNELHLGALAMASESGVDPIAPMVTLRNLTIYGPRINDAEIAKLSGMKELRGLGIGGSPESNRGITDASVETIARFSKLDFLEMRHCRLNSAALTALKPLPLRQVQFIDTDVTDACLVVLADYPTLGNLTFEQSPKVTDEGLKSLSRCKSLIGLNLYQTKVTRAGLEMLADTLPKCRIDWDGSTFERKKSLGFTNSLGIEFALVPKGKAWLDGVGGKAGDNEVEFKTDFYLGAYEVTQEEWEKIMGTNPSGHSRTGKKKHVVEDVSTEDLKRFPVESVSYNDSQEFVARLNEKVKEAGWVYRLPTQTEWQYACRGGSLLVREDSGFDYYFERPTNLLLPDRANFNRNVGRPKKVGSYTPNGLGLYDMHGNVGEWCHDTMTEPDGNVRAFSHGGSWTHAADWCRAVFLIRSQNFARFDDMGLRLARVPAP